jgi:hypothetical protein
LQTKGQQQSRINRQVAVMIAVCLIALALPLASVILSLQSFMPKESPAPREAEPEVSVALRSMLEGIAEEKLAPQNLENTEARFELLAMDLQAEKARVEALLGVYDGIAIPRSETQAEIRLLVQVPANRLESFLRACGGTKERGVINELSGGLVEVVIKKVSSP